MSGMLSMFADLSDAMMKSAPFLRGVALVVVAMLTLRVLYAVRRTVARRKTPLADRA
jgi:hypothetical protein